MTNAKVPDYRGTHVFDPIHNGADECECGLTSDALIHESDDAYEERMRPRIVNSPERIWLQSGCDDEVGEIDWKELSHSDVSWCDQRIDSTDIEYVRADLLATVRKEETEAAIDAVRACSTRDELHPDLSITVAEFKERVIGLLEAGLTEK